MTYSIDQLADADNIGVLLRVASDPPIRLWSGAVSDLAVPAGGAETTDAAIYQSHGMLQGMPQLASAINGDADRIEFAMSGAGVTGQVAALASDSAAEIRNVANDVGLVLFDHEQQLIDVPFWLWSGVSDSLTVERAAGDRDNPKRTIKLSSANAFSGRRRSDPTFYTHIDQERDHPGDAFCDQVSKLYAGATKVWGVH